MNTGIPLHLQRPFIIQGILGLPDNASAATTVMARFEALLEDLYAEGVISDKRSWMTMERINPLMLRLMGGDPFDPDEDDE